VQDIAIVAKEATFLICCATEEFIKRFGEAAMALAEREKRTTLQYKDMGASLFETTLSIFKQIHVAATVVRKADEFLFLEGAFLSKSLVVLSSHHFIPEIIPWTLPDAPVKRIVKASNVPTGAPTMLDHFVMKPSDASGEEPRIIVNEDGTMHVADSEMADDFA
jgi:DNA polymerase epsilon subunit 4